MIQDCSCWLQHRLHRNRTPLMPRLRRSSPCRAPTGCLMPSPPHRTCVPTLLAAFPAIGRRRRPSRRMHCTAHHLLSAGLRSPGSTAAASDTAGTLRPSPHATAHQRTAWRPPAPTAAAQLPLCRCRRPGEPQRRGRCLGPRHRRRFTPHHPLSPCLPPGRPHASPWLQPVSAARCAHGACLALGLRPPSRPKRPAAEHRCRRGQLRVSADQAPQPAAASQAL